MSRARISPARAVSYNMRHSVFSRSGTSRRDSSRSISARGSALVSSGCSGRRSAAAGRTGPGWELRAHQASHDPAAARRWFQVAGDADPPQLGQRGGDLLAGHCGQLPVGAELSTSRSSVGPAGVAVRTPGRGQEPVGAVGRGKPERGSLAGGRAKVARRAPGAGSFYLDVAYVVRRLNRLIVIPVNTPMVSTAQTATRAAGGSEAHFAVSSGPAASPTVPPTFTAASSNCGVYRPGSRT